MEIQNLSLNTGFVVDSFINNQDVRQSSRDQYRTNLGLYFSWLDRVGLQLGQVQREDILNSYSTGYSASDFSSVTIGEISRFEISETGFFRFDFTWESENWTGVQSWTFENGPVKFIQGHVKHNDGRTFLANLRRNSSCGEKDEPVTFNPEGSYSFLLIPKTTATTVVIFTENTCAHCPTFTYNGTLYYFNRIGSTSPVRSSYAPYSYETWPGPFPNFFEVHVEDEGIVIVFDWDDESWPELQTWTYKNSRVFHSDGRTFPADLKKEVDC